MKQYHVLFIIGSIGLILAFLGSPQVHLINIIFGYVGMILSAIGWLGGIAIYSITMVHEAFYPEGDKQ